MTTADIIATIILLIIVIAPFYFVWDAKRSNWYGWGSEDN